MKPYGVSIDDDVRLVYTGSRREHFDLLLDSL
jgi:hypothetical protein